MWINRLVCFHHMLTVYAVIDALVLCLHVYSVISYRYTGDLIT